MPDFLGRRYRFHYLTAMNLLESMGVPLGDIRVRAAGEYENYRGEIRSQDPAPGTAIPPGTVITLHVGCFSAVDFMPYQFFYGLQGIRESDNTWETDGAFDDGAVRRRDDPLRGGHADADAPLRFRDHGRRPHSAFHGAVRIPAGRRGSERRNRSRFSRPFSLRCTCGAGIPRR